MVNYFDDTGVLIGGHIYLNWSNEIWESDSILNGALKRYGREACRGLHSSGDGLRLDDSFSLII
jgi:hypothetical protein